MNEEILMEDEGGDEKAPTGSLVIPVIQEHLTVQKKIVETGKVNISKKVLTEKFNEDIELFSEEVIVDRIVINKYLEGNMPGIRIDGNTTIIPIVKEVVIKRLLLVEELYITKRTTKATVSVQETLKKEEVFITRTELPITEKVIL